MQLKVRPNKRLRGTIRVPGDKSISHRAVMLGSIAQGKTEIYNFLNAEDCLNTVKCFQALGIQIEGLETENLIVHGKGLYGLEEPEDILWVGNSGTTIRLLSGILSGHNFFSVVTGDESILRRPMDRIVQPLRQMGAQIWGRKNDHLAPLAIKGCELKPIQYHSAVASAQVKSAVLLAGLYADGITSVTEPEKSRDHTERMLNYFGADVKIDGLVVSVKGKPSLKGQKVIVPGDISAAAFFIVAAAITEESEIIIEDVGINPTRSGVIQALQEMGAKIELLNYREESNEPVCDIVAKSSHLKGIEIQSEAVPKLIDEIPILAVAACFAEGKTVIKGAKELRVKETDRIRSMSTELRKLGAEIEELPDGMVIQGGKKLKGARCHSHGDHRTAMALAIAALAAEGETTIEDTECINTSFPQFQQILEML